MTYQKLDDTEAETGRRKQDELAELLFRELKNNARMGFVHGPPVAASIDAKFDLTRVARALAKAGVTVSETHRKQSSHSPE